MSAETLRRAASRIQHDTEFGQADGDTSFLCAVADWLEAEAESFDTTELWFHPDDGVSIQEDKGFMFKHAFAVARAYLGGAA